MNNCIALTFVRAFLYHKVFHHFAVKLFRATHFMSLRGATRRGNLPEGNPCYKTHARYFCTCVEKRRTQAKE